MANLGNVVGLLASSTPPTKKYIIWAKPTSNPDAYTLYKYDYHAAAWAPYDVDRSFYLGAVTAINTNTLPSSPAYEEAYIIGSSPTGVAVGKAGYHALWDGYDWVFTAPKNGAMCNNVSNASVSYVVIGGVWVTSSVDLSAYELLSNKTNDVAGNSASTTKYASAKGVADYISYFDTYSVQPRFDLKANLVSPAFTGVPTAPTATVGTNTTQIATTAFVTTNFVPLAGGVTMAGLLTLSGDPTNAYHAATKSYVDNAITGLQWKTAVRAATTANITLSGTQTVDTVALSVGDRVLVKNQSTASENGIYVVASGSWARTTDADTGTEIVTATVMISAGSQSNTQWTCTNSTPPTIGSTSITFGQIAGAGTYTNGAGLSLTANVFSIGTASVTDAMIASASTWNGMLPKSGGTMTGALNEATIVTLASASNVDIVNIASNTVYITGTTGIATFTSGNDGMIRRLQFAGALVLQGGNNVKLPNASTTLTTSANDVGTFVYNSSLSKWVCASYTRGSASSLTTNRLTYFNGTDVVTSGIHYGDDGVNLKFDNPAILTWGTTGSYIQGGFNWVCGATDLSIDRAGSTRITMDGTEIVYRAAQHYFTDGYSAANLVVGVDTNGIQIFRGGYYFGSGSRNSSVVFQLDSTTKGSVHSPKMNTSQVTSALTLEASHAWDTTLHKLSVYNGSALKYYAFTTDITPDTILAEFRRSVTIELGLTYYIGIGTGTNTGATDIFPLKVEGSYTTCKITGHWSAGASYSSCTMQLQESADGSTGGTWTDKGSAITVNHAVDGAGASGTITGLSTAGKFYRIKVVISSGASVNDMTIAQLTFS